MKMCFIFGTRPEIIKLSELILLSKNPLLIHTGQHYSKNLSEDFFKELKLPKPHYNLRVGSGTHGTQTGNMLIELDKLFKKVEKPSVVIVQGDTNSALAGALWAVKEHIKVAHVEAGIRSHNWLMPEEVNRVIIDSIADYCFTPTHEANRNLASNNIKLSKLFYVGNTIVEVVQRNLKLAERESSILKKLKLTSNNYITLTAHRAENVDNKEKMVELIKALKEIKEQIIYPIHPRTVSKLKEFGLYGEMSKATKLIEPLGFLDFLQLCSKSKLIMTDSGGIQEECTIYKRPIIVLREDTERPDILGNFGWLTGCNHEKIIEVYKKIISYYEEVVNKIKNTPSPFGDGSASKKIIGVLNDKTANI